MNFLGTELPIVQAPMAGVQLSALAIAAVSYTHLTLPTNREV